MKIIVRTNIQPGVGTFINTYIPETGNKYVTDVDIENAMKKLWEEDYNLLSDEIHEDSYFSEDKAQIVTRASAIYYEVCELQAVKLN